MDVVLDLVLVVVVVGGLDVVVLVLDVDAVPVDMVLMEIAELDVFVEVFAEVGPVLTELQLPHCGWLLNDQHRETWQYARV